MSYLQDAIYAFKGVLAPCVLMAVGVALSGRLIDDLDTPVLAITGAVMLIVGIIWACVVSFFGDD